MNPRYRIKMNAGDFYDMLIAEVVDNPMGLDGPAYETLIRYYRRLEGNPPYRPFYRYNWIRRTEPMALLLETYKPGPDRIRILDAGCGVGSESLFWHATRQQAAVTGVDLSSERLETARARQRAYDGIIDRSSEIQFLEADVFQTLKERKFDFIWAMEAISHIDPAETFFAAALKALLPGGYLVISDSHLLNPAMAWRIARMRIRGVPLRSTISTASGKTIRYAHERLFSVPALRKLFLDAGFSHLSEQISLFFPPWLFQFSALRGLLLAYDKVMDKIPVLRSLGGIYTLSGRRPQ